VGSARWGHNSNLPRASDRAAANSIMPIRNPIFLPRHHQPGLCRLRIKFCRIGTSARVSGHGIGPHQCPRRGCATLSPCLFVCTFRAWINFAGTRRTRRGLCNDLSISDMTMQPKAPSGPGIKPCTVFSRRFDPNASGSGEWRRRSLRCRSLSLNGATA